MMNDHSNAIDLKKIFNTLDCEWICNGKDKESKCYFWCHAF